MTSEQRHPREKLTRRLERLLARVDATPERVVVRKTSLVRFIDVRGPVRVSIERIWVFGSYARGAPECADIDLLIKSTMSWAGTCMLFGKPHDGGGLLPNIGRVISPLIGPLRDLAFVDYDGLMKGDTVLDEQAVMNEAVLVWEPGFDWRSAIASIRVDAKAGRAQRPSTLAEAERIAEERDRQRRGPAKVAEEERPPEASPPASGGFFRTR